MFDFSLRLQILQSAELIFSPHLRIDPMQLIEINAVQAQPSQAVFACRSQMLRPSVFDPLIRTWPIKAALGGNHQPSGIRVQRLSYDLFADARTIGVGSVDEVDSQFDSATQNPYGLAPICRLAPNSISSDSHRAESQARNSKVVPDQKFARFFSGCLVLLHCELLTLHMFSLPTMKIDATNCCSPLE